MFFVMNMQGSVLGKRHYIYSHLRRSFQMKARRFTGFSLLELMLGLAIASIFILIMIQMLVILGRQYQAVYVNTQEITSLQWVNNLLGKRIYHAGFPAHFSLANC